MKSKFSHLKLGVVDLLTKDQQRAVKGGGYYCSNEGCCSFGGNAPTCMRRADCLASGGQWIGPCIVGS